MPKFVAIDYKVTINGTDFSSSINSVDLSIESADVETTAFGSTFTTRSTAKNGVIHADVCSQCHPFYTGRQKILDSGGRVAKFEKRFGGKDKAAASE